MFQYGVENWGEWNEHSYRLFAEYADLTSYWWTSDPNTRNVSYGHSIYQDGYRYKGRTIGHWGDQDSQLFSSGGLLVGQDSTGWGSTIRSGKLNEDGLGPSSVSNGYASDYFQIEVYNFRAYSRFGLETQTTLGWEEIKVKSLSETKKGLIFNIFIAKEF